MEILNENIGEIELELHEYKLVKINKIGKFCQGCLGKNTLKSASMGECQQWHQRSHKTRKVPVYYYYKFDLVWAAAAGAVFMGR